MTKSAALVYWDAMSGGTAVGKRAACDFETSISPILEAHLEFRSTFVLEVEDFGKSRPAAIAFYEGDTLLACQTLGKFGLRALWAGDTITIAPPGKETDQ